MKLEIKNKHALIREEEVYILVDTGCPITIERKALPLADMLGGLMAGLGMDRKLQNQLQGVLASERGQTIAAGLGLSDDNPLVDLDKLSKKVGVPISKLLGTDNMSNGPMLVDYSNGLIEFDCAVGENACELPCRMCGGIPIVTIKIEGKDCQMFLDTGAPTSYVSSSITEGMTSIGAINDFHPQAGDFTAPLFKLETTIADWSGPIEYGNLPPALAEYEKVGCDGIIGYDLFSRFAVTLDLRLGHVMVEFKMTAEEITKIVHKIRGNPALVKDHAPLVKEFSSADWIYLLDHCPNDPLIVGAYDWWERLSVDDLCDLLCDHPQLRERVPGDKLKQFKGGHWARLIVAEHAFGEKFVSLGLDKELSKGWCCHYHWAENYATCFNVVCATASIDSDKISRIANESAINPAKVGPACVGGHTAWLATVAADCAAMAAMAAATDDEERARKYCLVAQAANYQIQRMVNAEE